MKTVRKKHKKRAYTRGNVLSPFIDNKQAGLLLCKYGFSNTEAVRNLLKEIIFKKGGV